MSSWGAGISATGGYLTGGRMGFGACIGLSCGEKPLPAEVVDAELSPNDISNSFSSATLLSGTATDKPVCTRLMPGEGGISSFCGGNLGTWSGTGSFVPGDLLHNQPTGPAVRGVGVGDTDRARAFAFETSIGGVCASSPPWPITVGGVSVNCTLNPRALPLPLPFDSELTDWLRFS